MTPSEAQARYAEALSLAARGCEVVPIESALGRVLADDVIASLDLPPFERSAVDGWAVRAADTAGASEGRPVQLRVAGEVRMGLSAGVSVAPGTAIRVPTGGMLPAGADAVTMQEHVDRSGPDVLIRRAARSRENVIERGEDVRTGDLVLGRGRRLRPADLGILAGLGLPHVRVALPPRVAILATGDEVVGPGDSLVPGQVRDMNSAALAGAVLAAGGVPRLHGVVRDERGPVDEALRGAKKASEMVLISGGSSVGERDVVAEAIAAMGPPGIIVHGIAMRPGKPTVLAASGTVPVIGLPGNPVSALVIFDVFARPVIEGLLEMDPALRRWGVLRARLTAGLPGAGEREDHRRVRLEARSGGIWAIPLAAGSQVLTSLVRGDGIVVVAPGARYEEGDEVEVRLLQ